MTEPGVNNAGVNNAGVNNTGVNEAGGGMISPQEAAARVGAGLAARRSRERRFRACGRIAIGIALAFLVTLFVSIFSKGIPGFFQHYVTLEVTLDSARLDPTGDLSVQSLYDGDARGVIRAARGVRAARRLAKSSLLAPSSGFAKPSSTTRPFSTPRSA
jgi:hypothetical protein